MRRAVFALALAIGCRKGEAPAPTASSSAPAPSTSASAPTVIDASALVRDNCGSCHTDDLIAQQRLTPAQWTKVVTKMHGWGAPLTDAKEVELVAAWLASKYGPNAGPYAMPVVSSASVEAALAPQPDGAFASKDVAAGKALYVQQCAACHGPDAQGDKIGVNLVDRPLLFRAEDFARSVRVGRAKMPSFPALTDPQIGALLAHLRTLRPKI